MSDIGANIRARLPYSSIRSRPALKLPGEARLVVWTIVNVENWSPSSQMPRSVLPPPMGQPLLPDIPNWAWHEYGMRVGFWRLLDAIAARNMKATFAVNGSACELYREACSAALNAGWEFMGHGLVQKPMHRVDDQLDSIRRTVAAISDFAGAAPRGWESPGLTETDDTLDFLVEAGIEYVADWVLDDQPARLSTKGGPIFSIPYTVELNDVVITAIQQRNSDEIFKRGRDQFDRLYQEASHSSRVMAISLHPYLTGVPHRVKYLEMLYDYIAQHDGVLFWTGSQILDWYKAQAHSGQ